MNRAAFFDALRRRQSGVFGTTITAQQVKGIEALLDEGRALPLHHMANVLAQVYHETGGRMYPVRETFAETDAQAIARLDRAFARGQLPWVKRPYWADGWFGRGQIQITHQRNYARFGITDPQDAMRLDVSARVAVKGMVDGMFTGKKLADFDFPAALDLPWQSNPRRIVNGRDGTDAKVAGYHRAFAIALAAAEWKPQHPRPASPKPVPAQATGGIFATLLRLLGILK